MPWPTDATMKVLFEAGPADWVRFLGHPATDVDLIDADISTVSGAADKVMRVNDAEPWIQHVEFQLGPDATKPRKLNVYNSVMEDRHELPVRTALILLHKKANLKAYNGTYERISPGEKTPYRTFHYHVVRVWQLPPADLLKSVATLPLAPIANVSQADLPDVIDAMKQQLDRVAEPSFASEIWTATRVLLGAKYEEAFVKRILEEVQGMEESTTYQAIFRTGEAKGEARGVVKGMAEGEAIGKAIGEATGLREAILAVGSDRLGVAAPESVRLAMEAIFERNVLLNLLHRVQHLTAWEELFPPKKRSRKKNP